MNYDMQSQSVTSSAPSSGHITSTRIQTHRSPVGLPRYSQRHSLIDSLLFLSRSLTRMNIQHAVMGSSAIALQDYPPHNPNERSQEIELLMSPENYSKFRSTWVNQRLATIESEDHQFWDNRTGYLLRICVTGEWVNLGKRVLHVPDPKTLPKTADGIFYWVTESTDTRPKPVEDRRSWEKTATYCTIAA